MAGYSGTPLPKKLGIKEGSTLALVGAPDGFLVSTLNPLPDQVELRARARGPLDVIVFFTVSRAKLERRIDALTRALDPAGALWVVWPKRASGVPTDMTASTHQRRVSGGAVGVSRIGHLSVVVAGVD